MTSSIKLDLILHVPAASVNDSQPSGGRMCSADWLGARAAIVKNESPDALVCSLTGGMRGGKRRPSIPAYSLCGLFFDVLTGPVPHNQGRLCTRPSIGSSGWRRASIPPQRYAPMTWPFLRRAYLDLAGTIAPADVARKFIDAPSPTKRVALD